MRLDSDRLFLASLALVFGGLLVGSACRDSTLPAGPTRSADQSSQTSLAPAAPADPTPVADGSQALQRLREAEATLRALEAVEARIEALERRLAERAVESERAAQSLAQLVAMQERRRGIVLTNDDLFIYTTPPQPRRYVPAPAAPRLTPIPPLWRRRPATRERQPAPRREPGRTWSSSIQQWNDQLDEWRRERSSWTHVTVLPGYGLGFHAFGDGRHHPGHRRDQALPLVRPLPAPKPYVPPETFQSPRIQGLI